MGNLRNGGGGGSASVVAARPWDASLAHYLIAPLQHTSIHPNHVTTVGLIVGLVAAALYASGRGARWGALLFLMAAILDHADGELARMTGKTSAFGHTYDRLADLCVKFSVFTGMGLGLTSSTLGVWGAVLGLSAGVALVVIFRLRGAIARRRGLGALQQPSFGGFELEDVLYLIAPITWAGKLSSFVVAAGIGAPLFALWVARQYLSTRDAAVPRSSRCPS